MIDILIIIAPLFLIIFTAAILQRIKNVGEHWSDVLNSFALNIGLPALIFSVLAKASFSFSEQSGLIIANSVFLVGGFIAVFIIGKILRLNQKWFRTLFICLVFGNVAYLGIPVLTQVRGESVLFTASLIVAIYIFWMFTIGIGFLDYSNQSKKRDIFKTILMNLIKNPLLIAVFFGILVSILKISMPSIVSQSINMVSASVTPIVLVVIGLFIGKSKIGKLIKWVPVLFFSLVTLFVLPAVFYFGVKLFGFSATTFSASIIDAAMPLAITPFALADKYDLNKTFIARSIVLSTVLSALSIPFWISIL